LAVDNRLYLSLHVELNTVFMGLRPMFRCMERERREEIGKRKRGGNGENRDREMKGERGADRLILCVRNKRRHRTWILA
jgi:hypothetical protein